MSRPIPPDEQELEQLTQALARTLEAIDRIRNAATDGSGRPVDPDLVLPEVVRDHRPGESIPMLEQEAADLRRDIRALAAAIARASRS